MAEQEPINFLVSNLETLGKPDRDGDVFLPSAMKDLTTKSGAAIWSGGAYSMENIFGWVTASERTASGDLKLSVDVNQEAERARHPMLRLMEKQKLGFAVGGIITDYERVYQTWWQRLVVQVRGVLPRRVTSWLLARGPGPKMLIHGFKPLEYSIVSPQQGLPTIELEQPRA